FVHGPSDARGRRQPRGREPGPRSPPRGRETGVADPVLPPAGPAPHPDRGGDPEAVTHRRGGCGSRDRAVVRVGVPPTPLASTRVAGAAISSRQQAEDT